jgi:hypothetical protein
MQSVRTNRLVMWMGAFTLLSWLGEVIHNKAELPQLTLLSPENSITGLVSLGLFVLWWKGSLPWGSILLLAWALIHLIGGAILSVIPFSFLPFYPEQSLQHYAMHIVYGVAQIPLIALLVRDLRAKPDSLKETLHETPAL